MGAVDGTHVRISTPKNYEHNYVNRKGYHDNKNMQQTHGADPRDSIIMAEDHLQKELHKAQDNSVNSEDHANMEEIDTRNMLKHTTLKNKVMHNVNHVVDMLNIFWDGDTLGNETSGVE